MKGDYHLLEPEPDDDDGGLSYGVVGVCGREGAMFHVKLFVVDVCGPEGAEGMMFPVKLFIPLNGSEPYGGGLPSCNCVLNVLKLFITSLYSGGLSLTLFRFIVDDDIDDLDDDDIDDDIDDLDDDDVDDIDDIDVDDIDDIDVDDIDDLDLNLFGSFALLCGVTL